MDNSFLHRKKLLLVDDEPDLLKMVSDILKDAGFEAVLTAASVKEAVMVAKQEKPDLMILDVMLPDGDGFSLMEQLRTFTDVPVIFLTAKDEAADKLAGLQNRLCRRSYCCVFMRFCAALIKRTVLWLSWMDVRLILAGQRLTKAVRLSH